MVLKIIMKKKKIGIDFDDVLFGFNKAFSRFQKAKYGISVRFEDINQYDLSKVWGISIEEVTKRANEFYSSAFHNEEEPVPGSVRGVSRLKGEYELHLITSRHDDIRSQTIAWLDRHFPKTFTGIHLTNQFGSIAKKRLKSEVCRELDIDLMIEDAMHYARDISESGIPVILLNKPWNQGEVPDLVVRAMDWEDVGKKLEQSHAPIAID
jgi:uncharacterized HAD superfamily protein